MPKRVTYQLAWIKSSGDDGTLPRHVNGCVNGTIVIIVVLLLLALTGI